MLDVRGGGQHPIVPDGALPYIRRARREVFFAVEIALSMGNKAARPAALPEPSEENLSTNHIKKIRNEQNHP